MGLLWKLRVSVQVEKINSKLAHFVFVSVLGQYSEILFMDCTADAKKKDKDCDGNPRSARPTG